jgi:predicted Zn-dependent protease
VLFQRLRAFIRQRPLRTLGRLAVLSLLGLGLYAGGRYLWTHYWEPKSHFKEAHTALARRDFQEARRHLAFCLEAWPDDAASHFLAARAARRAGDLDAAEEELATCQRLQEKHPNPGVGDTTLEFALLEAQRGNLLRVEPHLRARLREDHPDALLILEVLSSELMYAYRLKEARQILDLWLQRQPEEYEALVRRGWVAEHLFDFPDAMRDYGKALSIDPDQDSVRLRMAELLLAKNRPADALEHVELLHKRQPDNPAVVVALARCYRGLDRFEDADRVLNELLNVHAKNAPALSERGLLALEAGRLEEAERLLRQAAALEPHNRLVNYNLSQSLNRLGKKEEAAQVTAKLAKADADLLRMGTLMREVQRRPHDPALRYEIGMIFLRNDFDDDGVRWLGTALQADAGHLPTHQALADYFERAGNNEKATLHRQIVRQFALKASSGQK